MSLRPSPCPPPILRALVEIFADRELPEPIAFAIARTSDQAVDVAVKPLPATDPVGSLYGFVAPGEWQSFGIATGGTAFHFDAPGERVRVHIVHAVDRSGAELTVARGGLELDAEPAVGRVPEICRRVLSLPTAPPTAPTDELWALDWLDRMLAEVLARDLGEPPPSWTALRRLDRRRPASEFPWAILRRLCSDGSLSIGGVPPYQAAWMDDGMFSREVIAAYPERDEMLADLAELLPAATVERIRRRLAGCTP